MMVVGTGNEGPACGSIADPVAIYDAVLSVGAIGRDGRAVGFSSRGPVTVGGSQRLKPDLVAPGLDIRSAVPGGYASLLGTSMASPHVAGGIAVLWSVEPALIGDLDRTEKLLLQTAQPLTVEGVCTDASGVGAQGEICGCGSDRLGSVPNNVYGWGRVDTWAAAQHLLGGE
jgi:subtilisin family serine protease